jgi:solute carrier family 44 (choline transporter-like protein), member 1
MTNRPFTLLGNSFRAGNETYTHAECVESCDKTKYNIIGNRCFEKSKDSDGKIDDDVVDFGVILSKSIGPIIISVIVAGVFSFIVLALFRHVIKHIIWGIYIGMVVFFILMSVGFIIASISASSSSDPQARESATVFLFPAAIFGILGIILAVVLYIFRVRIKLVIAIFKEASKVLQDVMPLLFQPVLTMISFLVALAIFGYFFVTISVSGPYQEIKNPESGRYELVENNPGAKGIASYTITGFVYFFFVNFILGCQHFIIASTVSQWYFTRDKTKLDAPISTAYSHLLSFHLGAICLGALLITIVKIVLGILRSMVVSIIKIYFIDKF